MPRIKQAATQGCHLAGTVLWVAVLGAFRWRELCFGWPFWGCSEGRNCVVGDCFGGFHLPVVKWVLHSHLKPIIWANVGEWLAEFKAAHTHTHPTHTGETLVMHGRQDKLGCMLEASSAPLAQAHKHKHGSTEAQVATPTCPLRPSCPQSFKPQLYTCPSSVRASVW